MEQITEGYEFIKNVITVEQDEVLRKTYALPGETEEPKKAPRKEGAGWIHHPCPRNVLSLPTESVRF
jgi:hypothetical protein